jgi:hypothetical protein
MMGDDGMGWIAIPWHTGRRVVVKSEVTTK